MIPVGAAIAGVSLLGKGLTSLLQGRRARQIDRNNPFPTEQVNPLLQKNVALAEQMARTGTPQEQYNNQLNSIQRNQAGALTRFGRNGRGAGSLASIVRAGNDATGNLNARDSVDRQNNQRFAFGQRGVLANEQSRIFDWNKRQPYLAKVAESQGLKGAAMQNGMSMFNDAATLGMYTMGNQDQGADLGGTGMLGGDDIRRNAFQRIFGGGRVQSNQLPRIG